MNKYRHIVQIGKYYPPESGGMELMLENISHKLIENGYQNDVLAFDKRMSHTSSKGDNSYIYLKKEQFKIRSMPVSLGYFFWMIRNLYRYKIVHIHLPNPFALVAYLLSFGKQKLVVHWHSDIIDQKLLYVLVRPFEQYLLKRADRIICTSESYRKGSEPLSAWTSKCVTVPIGIVDPLIRFQGNKNQSLSIYEKFRSKKLLFVGRLVPYKGLKYLVDAMRLLDREYSLDIIGDGPLKAEIEDQIKEHSLEYRIRIHGGLCEEEKFNLLEKTGILVLPSVTKNEAFGIVLLEAMAFKTPMISTNIKGSATGTVNIHGETGFVVEPANSLELADHIKKLFNHLENYELFSENCRRNFVDNYMVDQTTKKIISVYKSI